MPRYIATADNHLRYDAPICRIDEDWLASQEKALNNIVDLANTYEAELVIAGDLFDSYAVHSAVVSMFLRSVSCLQRPCHIVGGNHSLKYHREALAHESSIGILKAITSDDSIIQYHTCNEECIDGRFEHSYRLNDDVTLVHTLTFKGDDDIPYKCKAVTAQYLLDKYDTPWIFTGDMHHNFEYSKDDRTVINPGCMTVQAADMLDYTPGVYYIDTGKRLDVSSGGKKAFRITGSHIEFIPIAHDASLVTRNHLERNRAIDERLSAFVETINTGKELRLSFLDNLAKTLSSVEVTSEMDMVLSELREGK